MVLTYHLTGNNNYGKSWSPTLRCVPSNLDELMFSNTTSISHIQCPSNSDPIA